MYVTSDRARSMVENVCMLLVILLRSLQGNFERKMDNVCVSRVHMVMSLLWTCITNTQTLNDICLQIHTNCCLL